MKRKLDTTRPYATIHGSSDHSRYSQNGIKFGADYYEIIPSDEDLQKEVDDQIHKSKNQIRDQAQKQNKILKEMTSSRKRSDTDLDLDPLK